MNSKHKVLVILMLLLLCVSCANSTGEEKDSISEEAKPETISEINEDVVTQIFDDKQILEWIKKYEGRWVYEGEEIKDEALQDFEPSIARIELMINEPEKDGRKQYCIIGPAHTYDGFFFSVSAIEQQSEYSYLLTVEGLEQDWNDRFWPTNQYLIVDEDQSDDIIKLQFVGINKNTLEDFEWNDHHYDSIPLENFRLYDEYYLPENEWYMFSKQD